MIKKQPVVRLNLEAEFGPAFEKMAKKAIEVSVKTKLSRRKRMILDQKLNGLVLFSERNAAFSQFFQKP